MTWNTENSEIVGISGRYTGTATTLIFLPLTGTTIEPTSSTNPDATLVSNGKTSRLLSVNFMTDSAMGLTAFTLDEAGSTIATKTVDIDTTDIIYRIDFTIGTDSASDTNEFTGNVSIGVNPTTGGSTNLFSVVFERGLF